MGLAASQARFLAITARKANCEFQSLQIAQQKLSLARDMEKISDEYQNALNQTNLVWDPDGSGESLYELSYGLMMQPSALNNYIPYMVSRRDGKIALNSSLAAAAKAAGIGENGFDGDKTTAFNAFIEALKGEEAISLPPGVNSLTYVPDAGLGGSLLGRESGNSVTITSLISYIDMVTEIAEHPANQGTMYYEQGKKLQFNFDNCALATEWRKSALYQNGTLDNSSFTLADLLNEDIILSTDVLIPRPAVTDSLRSVLKMSTDSGNFSVLVGTDVKTWYDDLNGTGSYDNLDSGSRAVLTFVDQMAKGMYALFMPEDPSKIQLNAFYMAMNNLIDRVDYRVTKAKSLGNTPYVTENLVKEDIMAAEDYNCWVSRGFHASISFSNLAESFLTNLMNGMDGFSGDYAIYDKVADSTYVTDDPGYLYEINNQAVSDEESQYLYLCEFYSVLFNTICQNGWYENEYVEDEDYLNNALKTGQLFVVSKGVDNYFYQERYVAIEGGHIMENTDDDAIAVAEREYTSKKNKINIKEEELDIQAQELDAEISALTTEYDTVKSLISKNVEKTFTLFNN